MSWNKITDYKTHIRNNIKEVWCAALQSNCWEWQKTCFKKTGYGQISYKRKMGTVHRAAYLEFIGAIPEDDSYHGICVLHKCDNRKCCNPDHLFLGSHRDNMADMVSKNKQNKGERNANAVLVADDVMEIRCKYDTGIYSHADLADEYDVHESCISKIVNNQRWKHLTRETPQ